MATTESYIKVDTTAWERSVRNLTGREVMQSIRRGFRKSAGIIKKGIQKEVRAVTAPHRQGVKRYTIRGYYYPRALYKDVKLSVFRSVLGANVSLCNPKNPDNRAYVMRILNAGSGSRVTKKGYNRGSLRTLNFFQKAVDSTKNTAITNLDENIRKAVMKQVDKFK